MWHVRESSHMTRPCDHIIPNDLITIDDNDQWIWLSNELTKDDWSIITIYTIDEKMKLWNHKQEEK